MPQVGQQRVVLSWSIEIGVEEIRIAFIQFKRNEQRIDYRDRVLGE